MLIRPDLVAQRGVYCWGRLLYGEAQFADQVHAEKESCGPKKKEERNTNQPLHTSHRK